MRKFRISLRSWNFDRFRSQPQNSQQNILSYLFFYVTFVYGVTFAFFSTHPVVEATALSVVAIPPFVWGIIAMTTILIVGFTILFKWRTLAKWTALSGFCVWVYVFIVGVIINAWFAVFVIIIPMLIFWFFWFMGVDRDGKDEHPL